MTENEIWEKIRGSIHLSDMEIVKILIRFALWHNYFYYSSPNDITYFFNEYIKTAETFEKMCHRVICFNLYISGFINFCQYLEISHPDQKISWASENEFVVLEKFLDEAITRINKHFIKNNKAVTFSEVFKFIVNNRKDNNI